MRKETDRDGGSEESHDRVDTMWQGLPGHWPGVLRHALADALESTIIRGVRPPVD